MAFNYAWAGGEDVSFQNGGLPLVSGAGLTDLGQRGLLRAAYVTGNATKGNQFPCGLLTSAMMSWRGLFGNSLGVFGVAPAGGLGQFSSLSCLIVGAAASSTAACLYKFDGTTMTLLASEAGTSLIVGQLQKIDLQCLNYGAEATVKVWVDGNLVITFTGDVTVGSMTGFDCCVFGVAINGSPYFFNEVIVGQGLSDTRALRLATQPLAEDGDTDEWEGTYTDWNPVAIDDDNSVYTPTAAQDEQAKLGRLTGVWNVLGVLGVVRSSMTDGSPVTTEKIGWKTNSTVNVDSGHALSTTWAAYERFAALNPVTGNPWQWSEINAPLQIDIQSAA